MHAKNCGKGCDLQVRLHAQVKAQAQAEGKLLPPQHRYVRAVRNVGLQIAKVAGDGHGDGYQQHMKVWQLVGSHYNAGDQHACHNECSLQLQDLKWEFSVIDEPDQPNAFVVPGGKVVVYTGLLHLLQLHDDEIAAVLGHEVAHVLARHVVRPSCGALHYASHTEPVHAEILVAAATGREAVVGSSHHAAADRRLLHAGHQHPRRGVPARAVPAQL